MSRRYGAALLLAALIALAGCGSAAQSPTETPLTPVPVPTDPPTVAPADGPAPRTPNAPVGQPRYLGLRPTCERPPGFVVAIQVGALRNDPPGSKEGINTTWRFAAPSNQRAIGSFDRFVDVIEGGYGPLLDAETVTYGTLERENTSASLRVTVRSGNRTTAYRWELVRRTADPLEGCWLTTAVLEVDR